MSPKSDGENSPDKYSISTTQQMIASCSGAILTSIFVTPLDVVKIRLQAQHRPFSKGQCFVYRNGLMDHLCTCANGGSTSRQWYKPPHSPLTGTLGSRSLSRNIYRSSPQYLTGTLDAFIKISRYEGVRSLWSGLPPTLVMAVPATMVYFTCYDKLKYAMGYNEKDPNTRYIPIFAGTTSRIIAATIISPIELVRTKMQSEQLSYQQIGSAVRDTVHHGGFLALMRGLGPTLLRDLPFSALYWFGYEYVKALELKTTGTTHPTFVQSFTAGAISGTCAAVLTLPFDVIKTHRQIELGEAEYCKMHPEKGPVQKTTSTWQLIAKLYKQQGIRALYAGLVPRVVKIAPACAIMISFYEVGKTFFRDYNAKHYGLNHRTLS